jgi:hypothetical protein
MTRTMHGIAWVIGIAEIDDLRHDRDSNGGFIVRDSTKMEGNWLRHGPMNDDTVYARNGDGVVVGTVYPDDETVSTTQLSLFEVTQCQKKIYG